MFLSVLCEAMFFVFLVDLSKATLRCYTSICDGIIYNTNHSAILIFHSGEKNLWMSHGECQLRMSHANSYARAGKSQATVLTLANLTNVTLNLTDK